MATVQHRRQKDLFAAASHAYRADMRTPWIMSKASLALCSVLALTPSCTSCDTTVGPGEGEGEGEVSDPDALVRLRAEPESLDLVITEQTDLVVVGIDGEGDEVDVSNRLAFSSSDTAIVVVDNTGAVTAVAVGEARIVASFDDLSTEVAVRVSAPQAPQVLEYGAIDAAAGEVVSRTPTTDARGAAFSIAPALPVGLVLDTASGVISGSVDRVVDTRLYTVTATNDAGTVGSSISIGVRCDLAVAIPTRDNDPVDSEFVDANNDGIDGMACGPVFVSDSGNDANDGSRAAPVATLARALALVTAEPARDIYLAAGTYQGPLSLRDGVGIYGGYEAGSWLRSPAADTTIRGGNPAVVAVDLLEGASLGRVVIVGDNAITAGSDAVAVRVQDAVITLFSVRAEAGDGAPGAAGTNGADGADGENGENGGAGCAFSGLFCGTACPDPAFGFGGPGGAVGTDGGNGGGSGFGEAGGVDGSTAANGGRGGNAGDGGDFVGTNRDGADGVAGSSGSVGVDGNAGPPGTAGGTGGSGGDGRGGGGGGGGAGADFAISCNEFGGAGGGGGGGGAGGRGGTGGGAGGGSFALQVSGRGAVNGTDLTLVAGNGGNGGNGGRGGSGGDGGNRGNGGAAIPDTSDTRGGNGGDGGLGGDGGRGGHGGGGGGGPSAAVVLDQNGGVDFDEGVQLVVGAGGAGGGGPGRAGQAGTAVTQLVR
jgi:hypothetical protein